MAIQKTTTPAPQARRSAHAWPTEGGAPGSTAQVGGTQTTAPATHDGVSGELSPSARVDPKTVNESRTRALNELRANQTSLLLAQQIPAANQANAASPIEQAKAANAQLNTWIGQAGAAQVGVDKALQTAIQNGKPTLQQYEALVKQRANVAVQARMATEGLNKSIQQTERLLANPIVQKDAALVGSLKRELDIAKSVRKDIVGPFQKSYARLGNQIAEVGRKTGHLQKLSQASKNWARVGDGLAYASGITTGLLVGMDSAAQSQIGKFVSGTVAGTVNTLFNKNLGGVAAVDALTGSHVSNALNGVSETLVVGAEAIATGKLDGLYSLNEKMANGSYGGFIQAGSAAGHGIEAIFDPDKREDFVKRAERGDLGGFIGQFGNALGEGLGRLFFGGD